MNAPLSTVDVLLIIHCFFNLFIIYMTIRWGVAFWNLLSAGENGVTSAMMFYFFALGHYFISVFVNIVMQFSFFPTEPGYRVMGRSWNITAFAVLLFVTLLVNKKLTGSNK